MTNKLLLNSILRVFLGAILILTGALTQPRPKPASFTAQWRNPTGAVVPSATVTLTSQSGASRFALSGGDGAFVIDKLDAGSYTLSVSAEGFAPFDPLSIQVAAGKSVLQNIALKLPMETQSVTVSDQSGISVDTSADNNAKRHGHQRQRSRRALRRSR